MFLSGWSDASDTPTVLPSRGVKVWRPEFRVITNKPLPPLFAVLVQNGGRVYTWINIENHKPLTMVPGQDGKDSSTVLFDFVKAGGQKGARGFKAIKRADMCSLVVLEPLPSGQVKVLYTSRNFHVAATLPKDTKSFGGVATDNRKRDREDVCNASVKRREFEPSGSQNSPSLDEAPCSPTTGLPPVSSILMRPDMVVALEEISRLYKLHNMRQMHNAADLGDLLGQARAAVRAKLQSSSAASPAPKSESKENLPSLPLRSINNPNDPTTETGTSYSSHNGSLSNQFAKPPSSYSSPGMFSQSPFSHRGNADATMDVDNADATMDVDMETLMLPPAVCALR
jgi:hypothetical protein